MLVLKTRVRQARTKKGLTLAQLSKLAGVGISTLSEIERGVVAPCIVTALRIAKALNVRVEMIFRLESDE